VLFRSDVDTVCYTLAGMDNEKTGWGRNGESWHIIEEVKKLGGPTWFNLGDLDLATHLERTRRLKNGETLSSITRSFCEYWGVQHKVSPMSDQPVKTMVNTKEKGWLSFQEYFVKYQFQPLMTDYRFENIENAVLPPEAREALLTADWIILCPSNPFVSIEPILMVEDVAKILSIKKVLAVSPIIGGKAIKGPAAKMFSELGITPSAYEVLKKYKNIINVFLVDFGDAEEIETQTHWNIIIKEMNTIMSDRRERKRFASDVITYLEKLNGRFQ
jgi:LPPG:FO 2-phospho-L-lactate transferase